MERRETWKEGKHGKKGNMERRETWKEGKRRK
jgi:hypothetical protein